MVEIKKCSFCGSDAQIKKLKGKFLRKYYMECKHCKFGYKELASLTKHGAKTIWNQQDINYYSAIGTWLCGSK